MKSYIYFFIVIVLKVEFYCGGPSYFQESIFIKDFYFSGDSISKIIEYYNKSEKDSLSYEKLLEEIKFMILVYYWYKQNYSTEFLENILSDVPSPQDFSKEESLIYKMLVDRYTVVKGIYDAYNESKQNLDATSEYFYESLIIEGGYLKNPPSLQTFKPLLKEKFLSQMKKHKEYTNLKLSSKVTHKPISKTVQIDKIKKTFKIVLHTSIVHQLQVYNLGVFTFDNESIAGKCLKILHTNPSLTIEAFREFLTVQKIKFNYSNNNYNNEDLSPEVNGILASKNMGESCLIGERVVIILSKKSLRRPIANNNRKTKNIDPKDYENIKELFLQDFELMKKHVNMFYKKYAVSRKLCPKK